METFHAIGSHILPHFPLYDDILSTEYGKQNLNFIFIKLLPC